MICAGVLEVVLLLEFFFILCGISVMFRQNNAIQVILHGLGVLSCVWMILDGWSYQALYPITIAFGLVPFMQELVMICVATAKFRVMKVIDSPMIAEADAEFALSDGGVRDPE